MQWLILMPLKPLKMLKTIETELHFWNKMFNIYSIRFNNYKINLRHPLLLVLISTFLPHLNFLVFLPSFLFSS